MSTQKIIFEESDEIILSSEPTISNLGKTTYSIVVANLRRGLYGLNGNLAANLLLKVDFQQQTVATFIFKLPLSDESHKQFFCKVSVLETLSSVMPDMCEAVYNRMITYNPVMTKSTPISFKNGATGTFNANAPTFQPKQEVTGNIYPELKKGEKRKKSIIPVITPTAPPLEIAPPSYSDEELSDEEQESEKPATEENKGIMRTGRSRSKRDEMPTDGDDPPVYTMARTPSVGRRQPKRTATLNISNSDGTKTIFDVSGHLDASNIPKSVQNMKQAINTRDSKSYLDKSQKKEVYEKTVNKNKYSGDFASKEKRSIFSNGESSGKKKNATVDNSLKNDTRVGNHGGNSFHYGDD